MYITGYFRGLLLGEWVEVDPSLQVAYDEDFF